MKGEKSQQISFVTQRRKNGQEKLWTKIKTEDGGYTDSTNGILGEQLKFYEKLFKSEGCDKDAGEKLLQNSNKKLDDEDKDLLDSEVTGAEIEKVIKLLKKEKSPGEDGIISEFYQEYWYLIYNELTDVIKESFNTKTMSMSQYTGMMSLLCKKRGTGGHNKLETTYFVKQ